MPGLLKADRDDRPQTDVARSQGAIAKSTSVATNTIGRHDPQPPQHEALPLLNGAQQGTYNNQVNGDLLASDLIQAKVPAVMGDPMRQLPPQIEHITFGYLAFSDVITRLVQETFIGLTECISEMSELQTPQVNGATAWDTSQANVRKKLRLLDFAQARRAQFIKILVLSQWSRQAQFVSRVIDMKVWLDNKRRLYDDACNWMGELKRIVGLESRPNPDLKSALEALSLGKAPRLPDLGYIPPKPLPPQQLLKALRGINTHLSLRLHLHETIPPAFKDFSIANGRATFRVPDEFELDLSIADDDPSSQLYFIDFRFCFQPTAREVAQGPLSNEIEHRVNELLGREGLTGCYQFLHDFVLSHKINILRHQAYRLSQENWSEHIKIEAVHRSLIIQYWIGRPGGKNWIEIGIRRQTVGALSWIHQGRDEPHLGIRWFRAGKEVGNLPSIVTPREISVETVLKRIISEHTNFIFQETSAKLQGGLLYASKALRLRHTRSNKEPANCRLSIQLTATQTCTVIQEPVTGRLALGSPSSMISRAERELNSLASPEKDAASRIAQLRAIASCDEVEQFVRTHGWEIVYNIRTNQESLRQHFDSDSLKASFFRKRAWSAQWLLAFTASLAGDSWWIVRLHDKSSRSDAVAALGPSIGAAFKIPLTSSLVATVKELSLRVLSHIESTAVGLISQLVDTEQLSKQNIPHKIVRSAPSRSPSDLPALYVQLPKGRAQSFQRDAKGDDMPQSSQNITISFRGVEPSKSSAAHLIKARTNAATLRSKDLRSSIGDFIKFHPSSGFLAFPLSTSIGQSTIPSTLEHLARIQRLMDYYRTLKSFDLSIQTLSLDHVQFTYASNCSAKISFAGVEEPPQLSFNAGNPHLRIRDQLILLFRNHKNALRPVISFLHSSLPLMRALSAMEAARTDGSVAILTRSAEWYQMRYERPAVWFNVRLRRRREQHMWFVKLLAVSDGDKPDQRIQDRLDDLLKGRGEGWEGVVQGIAASLEGIEPVLGRIDEILQQPSHSPPAVKDAAEAGKKQDFKGQKRKAENDLGVVVLD